MSADTVGGVLTFTTELVRGLGDDVEVVVATMGAPLQDDQRARLLAAGVVGVHDGGHALEWMSEPWSGVREAGRWLLELEARERPDVVHLNGYAHGALPWSAPCVLVGHSCVLSWWRAVHGTPAPVEWDRYRIAVGTGLRAADAVIAPTAAMLAELRDLYGTWPGDASVIHNGWTNPGQGGCVHNKEPFVLSAGRMWDEAKNLISLDRAAAGLDWPVLVAGALHSPDGYHAAVSSARAVGPLGSAELALLRRRAAVFAAPARYEPFGLAILEAACDSCALVLGDIPSLRELWDGAARFVDPLDHRALHLALSELTRDTRQREQLGTAAARRAAQFGTDSMSAGYRELYGRLAYSPSPSPSPSWSGACASSSSWRGAWS